MSSNRHNPPGDGEESARCSLCGKARALRFTTNGMGRLVEYYEPCPCARLAAFKAQLVARAKPKPKTPAWRGVVDNARRVACICQLCDKPTEGRPKVALYCAEHKAVQKAASKERYWSKVGWEPQRRWYEQNKERARKTARTRLRRSKKLREASAEYKRLWRKANPEKVRAQKERAALRNWKKAGERPKRWREKVQAGEHKPKRARRNANGERLCCNGLCRQVVTGHANLCERCKAKRAEIARRDLETLTWEEKRQRYAERKRMQVTTSAADNKRRREAARRKREQEREAA